MGILSSGIALGGVIGLLLGGHLAGAYGWRVAFMTVGVPGFILAVLVSRLQDPVRAPERLTVRSFLPTQEDREIMAGWWGGGSSGLLLFG